MFGLSVFSDCEPKPSIRVVVIHLRPRLALGLALAVVPLIGCASGTADRADNDADRADAAADPAGTAGSATPPASTPTSESDGRPTVLFLGNSLAAGLGVDPAEAFPALIQRKIDEAGLPLRVTNAGVSGETTAGGLSRLDWLLEDDLAALVLELGANDALRGAPPEAVESNLRTIVDRTRARHPGVLIVLAGMRAPPNMGRDYADAFQAIFSRLASESDLELIPFILEGVAADPTLNQADGIHPTAQGHRIMAETVWEVLGPLLGVPPE